MWVAGRKLTFFIPRFAPVHHGSKLAAAWDRCLPVLTPGLSRGGGKVFPGPATFGGPAVAQKYWKWCSRWLLSDIKYAYNPFSVGAPPGAPSRTPLGELTTLRRTPIVRWWGDTPSYISSLSTPSASRSQDIQNGGVIVPRDNVFSGPAAALDGPV